MPYKFSNIGQVYSFLVLCLFAIDAQAQLDWNNDVVVFGTEQDESYPVIVTTTPGRFRVYCKRDLDHIRSKRSLLHGEAWEPFMDLEGNLTPVSMTATSDTSFSYLLRYVEGQSDIQLYPIHHGMNGFVVPRLIDLGDTAEIVQVQAFTDVAFSMDESYLFLTSLYRDEASNVHLTLLRSPNQGTEFADTNQVARDLSIADSSAYQALSATWAGNEERLWVAVSQNRPGSIGEQITLQYSDDLGQTWSDEITPDSSSYAQMRPSLAGRGETLFLAYQRRNSTSLAREIFVCYSPDNGQSWSEPMQLTDHSFDDTRPELEISGDYAGLFYARSQIQQDFGQLFFRQTSLAEPWIWGPETAVTEANDYVVPDGYSSASDPEGFAVVWTGRIVGDDGDVFFDASWRTASANEDNHNDQSRTIFSIDPASGRVEFEIAHGTQVTATLFDLLGRTVDQSKLSGPNGVWHVPRHLPSGSYWLTALNNRPIRIQIIR